MALLLRLRSVEPLRESELDLQPAAAIFVSVTASSLGAAGTSGDGFEVLMLGAHTLLEQHRVGSESLDCLINAWAAAGELVGEDTLRGERQALETSVATGDAILDGAKIPDIGAPGGLTGLPPQLVAEIQQFPFVARLFGLLPRG